MRTAECRRNTGALAAENDNAGTKSPLSVAALAAFEALAALAAPQAKRRSVRERPQRLLLRAKRGWCDAGHPAAPRDSSWPPVAPPGHAPEVATNGEALQ